MPELDESVGGLGDPAVAAVPSIPRRLFVATTFLAVILGMIAWLDRACIGK